METDNNITVIPSQSNLYSYSDEERKTFLNAVVSNKIELVSQMLEQFPEIIF